MSELVKKYSLADRPKWWLPKVMKWLTLIGAIMAVLMWLSSTIVYFFHNRIILDEGGPDTAEVYFDMGDFASEAAWASIGLMFYAGVFWFLSLAIDKIDQLVWLNASDEDKEFLIEKRKRKNAENQ